MSKENKQKVEEFVGKCEKILIDQYKDRMLGYNAVIGVLEHLLIQTLDETHSFSLEDSMRKALEELKSGEEVNEMARALEEQGFAQDFDQFLLERDKLNE